MNPEKEILKVLAYFDIFHYPLCEKEIRNFLNSKLLAEDFKLALERLHAENRIFKFDGFYCLRNDSSIVSQRIVDNKRAEQLLTTAYKIASFLFQFPFVRGIGISGSLSKNVANENTDIDFFIIAKSNRLWTARTIMHLFKKLTFLVGKQHWFCMNYFIDEHALQINEKNIFTAMEVVTLVPVCGNGTLKNFFDANKWTKAYFPNYDLPYDSLRKPKSSWLKKILETCLDNSFGEWLDNYLMKITAKRWYQKELLGKLNIKGGRMGLRTGRHFAKPNPVFFQERIILLYENKLKEIEKTMKTANA
jgi:hypothetical protein